MNGKDNASRDFVVRRKKVSDALHWLVKNNPLYTRVTIDYEQIKKLPDNGKLNNVRKVDFKSSQFHDNVTNNTANNTEIHCDDDDTCSNNDNNKHNK